MDKLFKTRVYYSNSDEDDLHSKDSDKSESEEREETLSNSSYAGKRLRNKNGCSYKNIKRIAKSKQSDKDYEVHRLPTRRPDPKVHNRNALMARENRRKKKQIIEQMENQLNDVCKENKSLKKLLKQQDAVIQKLNSEKSYLRSIISNRTEILQLLKTIGQAKIPVTSSLLCFKSNERELSRIPSSPSSFDDFGTVQDPNFAENSSFIDDQYFLFPDLDLGADYSSTLSTDDDVSSYNLNGWENLLNYNEQNISNDEIDSFKKLDEIRSEHNYTNSNNSTEPGVCLHVSNGRVSLEFCAQCHSNAQNVFLGRNNSY